MLMTQCGTPYWTAPEVLLGNAYNEKADVYRQALRCCAAVLLCCCAAVLLCCCAAVLLCCCAAVLLCCCAAAVRAAPCADG